jgi:hypothetical protein
VDHIRPQRVKKIAALKGVGIDDPHSAITVLNSVYKKSIIYDDMRALFIGLFSRSPNNLFESGQEAILTRVLEQFYEEDSDGEQLFDNLFTIQLASSLCIDKLAQIYEQSTATNEIYQRFFKDNIFSYRAFLSLLASCAASEVDISQGICDDERYSIRKEFLSRTIFLIENEPSKFNTFFEEAFRTIVMSAPKDIDEDKIKQYLWSHMKKQKFSRLLQDTIMSANISLRSQSKPL